MEQPIYAPEFLRQRKFFMILPLLVLPFVTLLFWALGGGKAGSAGTQGQVSKGFNMALPDAYLEEDRSPDKLSYYQKAASDSARLKELLKNDPYYQQIASGFSWIQDTQLPEGNYKSSPTVSGSRLNTSPYNGAASQDPNEAKVYKKLEQLNALIRETPVIVGTKTADATVIPHPSGAPFNSNDLGRLEQMMQIMNQEGSGDPEMQQLNGMLEKILDIQYPQRVREKIRQTSEARRGQVLVVTVNSANDPVSLLGNTGQGSMSDDTSLYQPILENGFYSWDEATAVHAGQKAIAAVVHETQTVVTGSTVKLRLTDDVFINGDLIPAGNFLYGVASLNGERLNIHINSIRYENTLFPVALSVYDMDGMAGIYVPGAITGEVARQSADRAIQDIGFTTLDPSLEIQAATAGVEAAKSLFSKKAKLVKVTVKAGYRVLLQDEKQQHGD